MRKTTLLTLAALLLIAGGAAAFFARAYVGDLGLVRDLSRAFMEDLQFKDFRSSKLYSHPLDQDRLDIGRTLERLFLAKPEFVDIKDFELVRAEKDSTGRRAKVLVRTRYKLLNKDQDLREGELILYWILRHPQCPLGGECAPQGRCIDEGGALMHPPDPEADKQSRAKPPPQLAADAAPRTEDTYACNPADPPRWFMNLDSTLKEKDYQ